MSDNDNTERALRDAVERPQEMNGQTVAMKAQAPQPSQQELARIAFDQHVEAIIRTSVIGLVATSQGAGNGVPVLIASCKAMARVVGLNFAGDLAAVLSVRKMCREAFNDALKACPVDQRPPQAQPMTAPVPGQGMPRQ